MAVLVFTALFSDDDRTKALSFRALELVAVGPLLATGLICLLTGVLLGGSKYGLLRYWWVQAKLALNLVLARLVLISPAPEVADHDRPTPGRRRRPGAAGGWRPDLPPDRVPDGPAGGDVPGHLQPWGRIRGDQLPPPPDRSGDAVVERDDLRHHPMGCSDLRPVPSTVLPNMSTSTPARGTSPTTAAPGR